MRVNEIFGPTIQGEGPAAGRRCGFLRLAGCNLDCTWCDTPYTWRWDDQDWPGQPVDAPRFKRTDEIHVMATDAVVDALVDLNVDLVVVSGGEPLLQTRELGQLLDQLPESIAVHVETNGTRVPGPDLVARVDQWVVSPKLVHSGVDQVKAIVPTALRAFAALDHAALKVVVVAPSDVVATVDLANDMGWPLDRVWVMPEGTSAEQLRDVWPTVIEEAVACGVNATQRLHVLAYDDRRRV